MKTSDYKWYDVKDILPENCEYPIHKDYVDKDFVVYLSDDYDPMVAGRIFEDPGRGWYWEFGIWNYLGDSDSHENSDKVTKWMSIQLPDE